VPDLVNSTCAHSQRKRLKGIMVHLDDARLHNSRKPTECLEQFRAHTVPHPTYSLDLGQVTSSPWNVRNQNCRALRSEAGRT
jgi:hypothetical protein